MRVVLFGLGSIGKRHAKILRNNFRFDLFAFRSGANTKRNDLKIKEIYSWKEVAQLKPDVAFIMNPTYLHIRTARKCAALGMHLFIEKPFSHNLKGIDDLERICRKKRLTCYTAYCLRFNPIIQELRKLVQKKRIYHVRVTCSSYLPEWRKPLHSRKSYSRIAIQGGGVLLDLSHEFDYIQYLFGDIKIISGFFGRASNVSVDAEDFADLLISARRAKNVNLHLNFFSSFNERRIVIDHAAGCIVADLLGNKIEEYRGPKKKIRELTISRDNYLKAQAEYFFKNLGNAKIMNNPAEAKKLLVEILNFKHG